MTADRRLLGKGLLDIVGVTPPSERGSVQRIPVSQIRPNPYQPRRRFAPEALEELAASIRQHGLVQPLVVAPDPAGDGYRLVAGERRYRAAILAGLNEVPCLVRHVSEAEAAMLALVENLQREDLSPLEEARGYAALRDEHGLTQEEIAKSVGKSRSRIANLLRLLTLPSAVQEMLEDGRITVGHALPLLGLDDPEDILTLAQQAAEQRLTARQVESAVRRLKQTPRLAGSSAVHGPTHRSPTTDDELWEAGLHRLQRWIRGTGVTVRLSPSSGRWRVVIEGAGGLRGFQEWLDRAMPPDGS